MKILYRDIPAPPFGYQMMPPPKKLAFHQEFHDGKRRRQGAWYQPEEEHLSYKESGHSDTNLSDLLVRENTGHIMMDLEMDGTIPRLEMLTCTKFLSSI